MDEKELNEMPENVAENPQASEAPVVEEAHVAEEAPAEEAAPAEEVPVVEGATPEKGKCKCGKRTCLLAAVIAGVLAVIAIAAVLLWPKSARYEMPEGSVEYLYDEENDKTQFFYNGEKLSFTMKGDYKSAYVSMNGTTVALISEHEDETLDGILYVCTPKALTKVTTGVERVRLSMTGGSLAYINEEGELWYYEIGTAGKGTKVTDEPTDGFLVQFSPDGKTLAYCKGKDSDLYVSSNGKSSKVAAKAEPYGLSNNAAMICYLSLADDALYMKAGDKKEKLFSETDISWIEYNFDHTMLLVVNGKGSYIVNDKAEKIKICSGSFDFVYPQWSGEYYAGNSVYTSPVYDFAGEYFVEYGDEDEEDTLYYLNDKYEPVKIAEDVDDVMRADKSEVIYYTDNDDTLWRVAGPKETAVRIADDVTDFAISAKGDFCYYTDEEDTLYYVKGTGDRKMIADDVGYGVMSHDDCFFFGINVSEETHEGTLCYSYKGGAKTRVADDVSGFNTFFNMTVYYTVEKGTDKSGNSYRETDVYFAKSKADFKPMIENLKENIR